MSFPASVKLFITIFLRFLNLIFIDINQPISTDNGDFITKYVECYDVTIVLVASNKMQSALQVFLVFKLTYLFYKLPGQYNPGKYGDAPAAGGFQQNQYRAQASAGFRQNYNKY